MPIFTGLSNIIDKSSIILSSISILLVTIALIAVSFNVIRFLWLKKQGEVVDFARLKRYILWSVIALTVMVAIWGIIAFISSNTGIGVGGCLYYIPASIPGEAPSVDLNC